MSNMAVAGNKRAIGKVRGDDNQLSERGEERDD